MRERRVEGTMQRRRRGRAFGSSLVDIWMIASVTPEGGVVVGDIAWARNMWRRDDRSSGEEAERINTVKGLQV